MKRYLLVFFAASSLLAEELTFVCDYEISYKNFAPTKTHIYFPGGQKIDFEEYDISNLCDQKKWEYASRNKGNMPDDSYCKEKEQRTIVINPNSNEFVINSKEYEVKNTRKNRKCFKVSNGGLCEFYVNFVKWNDDELKISVQTRYQPEWCPIDMNLGKAFEIEDEEYKKQILSSCENFDTEGILAGVQTFDGDSTSISINRSTLKYTQDVMYRKIYAENGEPKIRYTRGKSFARLMFGIGDAEETGSCRVYKKQF